MVIELMKECGLTRNQISQISGLSNSHLIALEREYISRIRRDTVITLALALNIEIRKINELLDNLGLATLRAGDIPVIIKASDRRNITGLQPLHEGIGFENMLIAMEKTKGDLVIVNNKPPSALLPLDYLSPQEEKIATEFPVYRNIKAELNKKRRKVLDKILATHCVHLIVCGDCIRQYMAGYGKKSEVHKSCIKEHLRTLIRYLKHPRYQFDLINSEACPSFRFQIKFSPKNRGREKDIAFFIGYDNCNDAYQGLQGFATDRKNIISALKLDYLRLRNEIDTKFSDKEAMQQHLEKMFKEETGTELEE